MVWQAGQGGIRYGVVRCGLAGKVSYGEVRRGKVRQARQVAVR